MEEKDARQANSETTSLFGCITICFTICFAFIMANIVKDSESKRIARCAGCSEPLNEHQWGIASKFFEGKFKSSPAKPHDHSAIQQPLEKDEIEALVGELPALCLEEERLAQERGKRALRKQMEENGPNRIGHVLCCSRPTRPTASRVHQRSQTSSPPRT